MTLQWSIGIDMGGTFIDVVACSSHGELRSLKHPREDGHLVQPILQAVQRMLDESGIEPAQVARIVHGSTVVTNLLLEQNDGPIAVITNAGMRDVLALARQDRRDLYTPAVRPPTPERRLFPAALRFEIAARVDAQGTEIEPLQREQITALAHRIAAEGVRAVAVCLLFSHLRPAHEQQVREWLLQAEPQLMVSLSAEVDPKPREFERFLATAFDAYSKPLVQQYLRQLGDALATRGLPAPALMRSEGGIAPWQDAAQRPIGLAMSGPCAALQGVAASLPDGDTAQVVMSIDVGGTSTDIGILEAGRPLFTDTLLCGELALRLRCADVESLSLGGGSLASVNAGGGLRLGPRSQGASPGPAAYGLGGTHATLTDALLLLDRLPRQLSGGVVLDVALAQAAIERDIAQPLGIPAHDAARAIVATAATAMAESVKMRAFQRNIHPADCVLVAAGGGGAQHVAEVAELAGVSQVRVIAHAGVVAALGLLASPPTQTVEKACALALDSESLSTLVALRDALQPATACAAIRWSLEIVLKGQGSPVEVAWSPDDDLPTLQARFAARYEALRGQMPAGAEAVVGLLRGVFEQDVPTPGVQAHHLRPDPALWAGCAPEGLGPQALFAATTTVWVPAGWQWRLEADGSLWLSQCTPGATA
ncbi:hydantoinase/oxoprolinase family protein [Hydrogenophaga sp. BPS33]|uniref:hydantoinase/oxoprolinase family protein n=1 Tax=Hydrogenophaga sp. BPS33 TaxID=2651974 RepID=UPI00131FC8B1|nr:hydantoinase/oxoprolinase family protein [Hydrogenophaga sp. BPS33]QHE85705.1 hydantoinase/oxoprolinase family protein [Hydrogenophaga sp. BPS33]